MIFKPKGEIAEWRIIYDLLCKNEVGDVVSYDDIEVATGKPTEKTRSAFSRAKRELLEADLIAVENIRGVGYQLVGAVEHIRLANRQQAFGRRRLTEAHRLVTHTDVSDLSIEDRARLDRMELLYGNLSQVLRRHGATLQQQSKTIAQLESRVKGRSSDDLARDERMEKLEEALRRHGLLEEAG